MSFNKLLLISEDRLADLQRQAMGSKQHTVKSFVQLQEETMSKIMDNALLSDDEKIAQYSSILRQLIEHLHPVKTKIQEERSETVVQGTPAVPTEQVSEGMQDNATDALDNTIPPSQPPPTVYMNSVAKQGVLRAFLENNPKFFGVAPSGEIVLMGKLIEGTNYEELVNDFSNAHRWNSAPPVGSSRLRHVLQKSKFPAEMIANRSRRWTSAVEPSSQLATTAATREDDEEVSNDDRFGVRMWGIPSLY